ncbi:voltage-gated potassium channel [Lentibacillus halodurans]|uniref:Voltage-gated potassium channel n=2 Tax=Lentibacillus halodurans TaxID=237679 RepID=A0A1I0WL66_9BACI|nr:voltage-gated potassium channel [Lentibacillus halodurans]
MMRNKQRGGTMEERNFSKLALAYEVMLVCLAILSVLFIWSDNQSIRYLDRFVWAIFFIDVCVRLVAARNKWAYVKKNPFDIIAAIPLDAIFQTARIARLFKLLRLIAISKHYFPKFFQIIRTNNLDRVIVTAVLMIVAGGTVVTFTEPNIDSFADGLWWAIVTTTTVGYGDISPDTIIGRIVAVILMLAGIGIIGMLTSSITTFFIKGEGKEHPSMAFMKEQLNRADELTSSEIRHMIALLKEFQRETEEKDQRE